MESGEGKEEEEGTGGVKAVVHSHTYVRVHSPTIVWKQWTISSIFYLVKCTVTSASVFNLRMYCTYVLLTCRGMHLGVWGGLFPPFFYTFIPPPPLPLTVQKALRMAMCYGPDH